MISKIFSQVRRFLKLWLLMFITFVPVRMAYNIAYFGWLDLRPFALLEIGLIPFFQALAFLVITAPFSGRRGKTKE